MASRWASRSFWLNQNQSETGAKFFSLQSESEEFVLLVSLRSKRADFRCKKKRKQRDTKLKKRSEKTEAKLS
jgi:hypothetical protein